MFASISEYAISLINKYFQTDVFFSFLPVFESSKQKEIKRKYQAQILRVETVIWVKDPHPSLSHTTLVSDCSSGDDDFSLSTLPFSTRSPLFAASVSFRSSITASGLWLLVDETQLLHFFFPFHWLLEKLSLARSCLQMVQCFSHIWLPSGCSFCLGESLGALSSNLKQTITHAKDKDLLIRRLPWILLSWASFFSRSFRARLAWIRLSTLKSEAFERRNLSCGLLRACHDEFLEWTTCLVVFIPPERESAVVF